MSFTEKWLSFLTLPMFSLIITIISIALVAALALATLYYGGNAFNQGRAEAEASKLINQGQQLAAASELYKSNYGVYPADMAALVSDKYLQSIPQAKAAVSEALAAETPWMMPAGGVPVFTIPLKSDAHSVCAKVNLKMYGKEGILTDAREALTQQCYGAEDSLTVLVGKGNGSFANAGIATVSRDIPQSPSDWDWSWAPGAAGWSVSVPSTPLTPPQN